MIVVVGMAFEARIAAGLGVPVVCGGDGRNLSTALARAMAARDTQFRSDSLAASGASPNWSSGASLTIRERPGRISRTRTLPVPGGPPGVLTFVVWRGVEDATMQ